MEEIRSNRQAPIMETVNLCRRTDNSGVRHDQPETAPGTPVRQIHRTDPLAPALHDNRASVHQRRDVTAQPRP